MELSSRYLCRVSFFVTTVFNGTVTVDTQASIFGKIAGYQIEGGPQALVSFFQPWKLTMVSFHVFNIWKVTVGNTRNTTCKYPDRQHVVSHRYISLIIFSWVKTAHILVCWPMSLCMVSTFGNWQWISVRLYACLFTKYPDRQLYPNPLQAVLIRWTGQRATRK